LRVFNKRQFDGIDVDLSHVRLIFNGAEPISASLCEEFLTALEPYGLSRNAMFPVYGLAEASLAVSFRDLDAGLRWTDIDRRATGLGDPVQSATDDAQAMRCVSVGHAIGGCRIRIVSAGQEPLPDGTVGRILINGPNVTAGYYRDPGATEAAIDADGWLNTGDLGFLENGELFITGREKDVLFVNGQNFYAHDLEAVALQSGRLQLGKVAVGSYRDEGSDTDKVLVFVLHRGNLSDFVTLARDVTGYINEHTGAEVSEVVPVPRILKTTSGKLQRFALVDAYLAGEFDDDRMKLQQLAASVEHEEPATDVERRLRAICDQALGDIGLGRHDNFFETGASSLKLIEIHEQIEDAFPGCVELTDLFDFPTLAELAEHLERRASAI
jgi:acyl-CoA synthetase (AMP-forming)/AMP-acid ligase II/acyl carrier protein